MANLPNSILVDSNYFIALAYPEDPKSKEAENNFISAIRNGSSFITNQYIVVESLTVVLFRSKNKERVIFLKEQIIDKYRELIHIERFSKTYDKTIYEFLVSQIKYKGFLSFIDCSLIIQARKQKINTIFTFDSAFKQFGKEFKIVGV